MDDTFGEMLDTSPEQRRRYYELLRALTPEQRAQKAASLSRSVRALVTASLQRDHPLAGPAELRARLATRLYGREQAARAFGPLPDDAT